MVPSSLSPFGSSCTILINKMKISGFHWQPTNPNEFKTWKQSAETQEHRTIRVPTWGIVLFGVLFSCHGHGFVDSSAPRIFASGTQSNYRSLAVRHGNKWLLIYCPLFWTVTRNPPGLRACISIAFSIGTVPSGNWCNFVCVVNQYVTLTQPKPPQGSRYTNHVSSPINIETAFHI